MFFSKYASIFPPIFYFLKIPKNNFMQKKTKVIAYTFEWEEI